MMNIILTLDRFLPMFASRLLVTCDVGYLDEDGFVFIVDRTKDMLLCVGYNVDPRVLKEAIHRYPAVEGGCRDRFRDEYRGQAPKAFVEPKDGAVPFQLKVLRAFLKAKLAKSEMGLPLEIWYQHRSLHSEL